MHFRGKILKFLGLIFLFLGQYFSRAFPLFLMFVIYCFFTNGNRNHEASFSLLTKICLLCLICSVGLPWDLKYTHAQGHWLSDYKLAFLFLPLYLTQKHKNSFAWCLTFALCFQKTRQAGTICSSPVNAECVLLSKWISITCCGSRWLAFFRH